MALTQAQLSLISLFAGAVIAQTGTWIERVWRRRDTRDERLELKAEREAEAARLRLDNACEQLLMLSSAVHTRLQGIDDSTLIPTELHETIEAIDRASVYVPDAGLRLQLGYLSAMIWWGDQVAPLANRDAHDIAWDAANRIYSVAGALLRREAVPPAPDWYEPLQRLTREVIGTEPLT